MTDGDIEGFSPWEPQPGKVMPYDMLVPGTEVYVSPEIVLKAIDHLAEVMVDEKAEPELRVQAASAIIAHHARRRPS